MSIITLIITLAIIGFLLWLVLKFIPMAEPFPKIITIIVILTLAFLLMR